jgi:hypothetical protein
MRTWKVAVSLALIVALMAPVWTGSWRLREGKRLTLSPAQRLTISRHMTETKNCRSFPPNREDNDVIVCMIEADQLASDGDWVPGEKVGRAYLTRNLNIMAISFFAVFLIAMVLPFVGRRYWTWLKR